MLIQPTLVRFAYAKTIAADSQGAWEKAVFLNTHREFFMQAQQFDLAGDHQTFSEILSANPKAEAIHYLVSTSVAGYLKELGGLIPDVYSEGRKLCLRFKKYRFEVLQSHKLNTAMHRVMITFYSEGFLCLGVIGDRMVLTEMENHKSYRKGEEVETFTLSFISGLSVANIQSLELFDDE